MGFDSWDMYNVGEHNLFPGPIDNSGLFSGAVSCAFLTDMSTRQWSEIVFMCNIMSLTFLLGGDRNKCPRFISIVEVFADPQGEVKLLFSNKNILLTF